MKAPNAFHHKNAAELSNEWGPPLRLVDAGRWRRDTVMKKFFRLPWWWGLALLAVLNVLGLYSLTVWTFFMWEDGYQIGIASYLLLTAPMTIYIYGTGKYKRPSRTSVVMTNDGPTSGH